MTSRAERLSAAPTSRPVKPSRALTREDLIEALAQTNGNLERTASALGIVRNTLKAKLRQFGLRGPG
jgi:transcriptional regulator of acetoin/glycerol metabolism